MTPEHIEFPVLGAKWFIGVTGLTHVVLASLAIGFAFIVTAAQIAGYVTKDRAYDLIAKRVQLFHVCIYNLGTIFALGLIFGLSGLFPQFWSQLFVHQFWTLILEELLFILLAITLTLHYFFWDRLWGHKKMHIFMGALLTPLFLLQFFLINGIGSFMLTPGFEEAQASLSRGILGWDKQAFYNPSFLMLTLHRAFVNFSYGGFMVAGLCGYHLFKKPPPAVAAAWEKAGRLAFTLGFMSYLTLPIIGYFYAHVLKYEANEAFVNLMWGRGDIIALGIDWWWVKHLIVAAMFGMTMHYFWHQRKETHAVLSVPAVMVASISLFYLMFYLAMGMIMTYAFFWWMVFLAVAGALLARHLINYHHGSPRALFTFVAMLSVATVVLGGYAREASRPRFIDRISHYDSVYVPEERAPYLMVPVDPADIPAPPPVEALKTPEEVRLIRLKCIGCHTLERVQNYRAADWRLIVRQMQAYGLRLSTAEAAMIIDHLESGEPY